MRRVTVDLNFKYLCMSLRFFSNSETSWRFLTLVNQHNFEAAMEVYLQGQRELKNQQQPSEIVFQKNEIDLTDFKPMSPIAKNILSRTSNYALVDAAKQMQALLNDHEKCLFLLRKLDQEMAKYSNEAGWDLQKITPGEPIQFRYSLCLPSALKKSTKLIPKTETCQLHLALMRKQLQKNGIEEQPELYKLQGFVSRKSINSIVQKGALFTEEPRISSFLVHGIEPHFFQWYLFSSALQEGFLRFKNGVSLRTMLSASVLLEKYVHGLPLWNYLIDFSSDTDADAAHIPYSSYSFGFPHRLHIFLLLSPEIPYLRGYMLNQWYLTVADIQEAFFIKYKKEIPYECLVGVGAQSVVIPTSALDFFSAKDYLSKGRQSLITPEFFKTKRKGVYCANFSSLTSRWVGVGITTTGTPSKSDTAIPDTKQFSENPPQSNEGVILILFIICAVWVLDNAAKKVAMLVSNESRKEKSVTFYR